MSWESTTKLVDECCKMIDDLCTVEDFDLPEVIALICIAREVKTRINIIKKNVQDDSELTRAIKVLTDQYEMMAANN